MMLDTEMDGVNFENILEKVEAIGAQYLHIKAENERLKETVSNLEKRNHILGVQLENKIADFEVAKTNQRDIQKEETIRQKLTGVLEKLEQL